MEQKEISLKDFQDFLSCEEVRYASSTWENKSLSVSVGRGNMIVRLGKKIVYQGVQPYAAIEAYNNITEKWIY